MALCPLLLAAALAAAPPSDAPDPWSGLLGSGLLTLQDTATLAPGRVGLGLTIDNRDRRNALPPVRMRPSPLAGFVDLTPATLEATAAYLQAIGFAGAVPELRTGAHRLLVPPPGAADVPLPAGARVIPAEYRISSEHQLGFLFVLSVSF